MLVVSIFIILFTIALLASNDDVINTIRDILIVRQDYRCLLQLISNDEIFQTCQNMGFPLVNYRLQAAAAVCFDNSGKYTHWIINPFFWRSLDSYQKFFVLHHEALHIIRGDGDIETIKCIKDIKYINILNDVAINHALVNKYGFKRELADPANILCWWDTAF